MICRCPRAWLLAVSLSGIVGAASGCGRPNVAAISPGAAAVEQAPHSSGEADRGPADDRKDGDAPVFQFPDDAGGQLLARVLPPADVKGPLNEPNPGPHRPTGVAPLAAPPPSLPLPPSQAAPPPVPGERNRKSPAPRLVSEETLGLGRGDPQPPAPRAFYVGDRTRLPSVDVNQAPPLPILTQQPTPDRASLDSPTADDSAAAALSAPMPQRTRPVAYSRLTLPDPFDNRRPLNIPVPAEDDNPRTGTVHPPKP
jgi:hypothetical protein